MIATALLAGLALAGPVVSVAAGVEATVNNPYVRRAGPTLSVAWLAAPRVELGLRGVWFPRMGSGGPCEPDATEFTCGISEAGMSPGVAYLTGSLSLELRIAPVVAESGPWQTALGVAAGGGLVTTEDDLELLQAEGEPSDGPAHRTANQAHPATSIALIAELLRGRWTLRLRFGALEYIEVLHSNNLLLQTELLTSVEVGTRW